jgi:hypothetical protein
LILSKTKIGFKSSLYFLSVERLADLIAANSIFFALGFVSNDLKFSRINFFGWAFGVLFLSIIVVGGNVSHSDKNFSFFSSLLKHFRRIYSIRDISLLCGSIFLSWSVTAIAFLVLGNQERGVVQKWVSLNSSFSDPLTMAISTYNVFFLTLLIPLALAYLYSLTIRNSSQMCKGTLKDFLGDKYSAFEITPFTSNFAGSGSELFTAKMTHPVIGEIGGYMLRIESRGQKDKSNSSFMQFAPTEFKFPNVYFKKNFLAATCIVSELIVDSDTDSPSENVFEKLFHDPGRVELLGELVELVLSFHQIDSMRYPPRNDAGLGMQIQERIQRANSFTFLKLNQCSARDREAYSDFHRIIQQLIYDLDWVKSKLVPGICHGDASLTNFLFQEMGGGARIRSIDPNPRFQIANLEFDLAKIMQSTHALYDYSLINDFPFPETEAEFVRLQADLGWSQFLEHFLANQSRIENLDYRLLKFFLLLHLIRIVPYKIYDGRDSLRSFLGLITWVDKHVDF